ncbi:hypothetical protein [Jeotgalibacillus proteolyticus]|uniref:Uncharacterized protein n=1 Tax=Jeotgalibacillus proteolyticus TaxID=2082395 RepID=A0A2S5G9U4_9BACL|nr:hypothetical protein [Jeotgalibacillus proteolyticus]PPA69749.1 hypothetical protein C4B60_14525 [Jeotgalibacillus proteolyticus]
MLKKMVGTGLAIGLAFGATGAGAASTSDSEGLDVDLSSKLNAELSSGELMSSQDFKLLAEENDWNVEDLQIWAEANSMTEVELQEWAKHSGWSDRDSTRLDLDLNGSIELDNLLGSNNNDHHHDNDKRSNNGLLGGLLNGLF